MLVLSLLVALSTFGQQKPPYGETLEVHVMNVDVVVTDRGGKPVTGLTRDDFELYENGKRKDISNFYEVNERAAAATAGGSASAAAKSAAAVERRHLIVFLDNTTLQPFTRNKVIASMTTFIQSTMRPNDEAMIVTWNPGLKENLALTTDRARVLDTLQQLAKTNAQGVMLRVQKDQTERELRTMISDFGDPGSVKGNDKSAISGESGPTSSNQDRDTAVVNTGGRVSPAIRNEKPPYDRGLAAVRNYADAVMFDTKQKAEALSGLVQAFRGVQGRKAMIFVTESFSTQPARQMFEYLDAIKENFDKGNFQNPRAEISRYNDEPLFANVTNAANAAGVTLYTISASGAGGGIDMNDASTSGAAVQSKPVGVAPGKMSDQSLQELAAATGGLGITGTKNFDLGFDRIASDLTMFYSLGYRADATPASDVAHRIEVKVKKPGLVVRTRESFVQKAPATDIGDTMGANLFAGVQKNDMGISVTIGAKTGAGDDISVPVIVTIPSSSLTFVPDGKDMVGKFALYAAFKLKDGTGSKVSKVEYPLRVPADSLQDQRNVTVKLNMTTRKDTDSVSVAVQDETSNATGFATTKLQ